jgi:hypothetical protein
MRIHRIQKQHIPERLSKRKKAGLNGSKHLTVRFARQDWDSKNTDGSSVRRLAQSRRGFNMITIRPAAFKKSEGIYVRSGRLLRDVQIPLYQRADDLFSNLTKTIIHKSVHCILGGESQVDTLLRDHY